MPPFDLSQDPNFRSACNLPTEHSDQTEVSTMQPSTTSAATTMFDAYTLTSESQSEFEKSCIKMVFVSGGNQPWVSPSSITIHLIAWLTECDLSLLYRILPCIGKIQCVSLLMLGDIAMVLSKAKVSCYGTTKADRKKSAVK